MSGKKLSKRDSEDSFLVEDYLKKGILPEALINYVALFGWSPKTITDIQSMDDLVSRVYLLQIY